MPKVQDMEVISELSSQEIVEYYERILSYIRSRLNVIGTSLYLLQENFPFHCAEEIKYFNKINEELESIRRLINN